MSNTMLDERLKLQFLIITSRGYSWIDTLRDRVETVDLVNDPDNITSALTQSRYDIVLYDDSISDTNSLEIIEQIRLLSPKALIAIVCDSLPNDYYDAIIKAGGADAIATDMNDQFMLQRLSALMRQSQKNRELANRTRRLHAINLLSQSLHNATHPKLMIVEAIELICNYFEMYGVAITILRNEVYQLYAGTREDRRRIYESKAEMRPENPLRQVIDAKLSLIFPNVQQHPYYKAIPVLESPESSVIVPIKIGNQVLGSIALFSDEHINFKADVAVFELLGSTLGTAYQAVYAQHSREVDLQSMRYMLKAWPELNATFSKSQIAEVVHNFVQNVETVSAVSVWLFSTINPSDSIVYSDFEALQTAMVSIRDGGHLNTIVNEFEDSLQPRLYKRDENEDSILYPLFEVLGTSRLTLVPITGNSFEGMMVLGTAGSTKISPTDMSLIENLSRVTANVLERNTLIESIQEERIKLQEQTGRVEGVLRSIDEGIFFVDDSRQVVYSNPQLFELTHITPSQVLEHPFTKLFKALSAMSSQPTEVYERLVQAAAQIEGRDANNEEVYPFVEIQTLADGEMVVEFMRVNAANEQRGWIGVIGQAEESVSSIDLAQHSMLQNMLEDMTMPIIELSNTTMTLPQQYDILSPTNFETLLQRLEGDVQQMQSMWGNFVQIYKGEIEGIKLRATKVDPGDFIEGVLTNRRMLLYSRQIRFDRRTVDATVRIDERQMRQCFINLVEFLSHLSNRGAPIFVEVSTDGRHVSFTLQEKTTLLPDNEISNIFTPRRDVDTSDDLYPYRLGMYLAQQIVKAHGGQLNVTHARGQGLTIKLLLPLIGDDDTVIPIPDTTRSTDDQASYKQPSRGLTMTIVESQSRFLDDLYAEIEYQGHELFAEINTDGLLFNLKATKVDIIVLEVDSQNIGLVGQVQRIRAQSEVPIVIIALPEFEDDCLAALAQGADDYFLVPINEEKLLAQLNAIAKRQELAARTAEPIKVGDLEIDFSRRRVYLGGKLIDLTAKEYELLRVLAMNQGHVMSHKRLLSKVWGPEHDNETQYLWVNISRLRRKLEPQKDSPRYIKNEPRVGYVFAPDLDE